MTARGRNKDAANVRTLVVTVSPLLADLATGALQAYLPLDVIGVLPTRERLAERLRELAPDLVLLGLAGAETDACARPLLAALPSAQIVVLAANGQHAWLYEMRPHRTVLANLAMPTLIGALTRRFKVAQPRGRGCPGPSRK